MTPCIIQAKSDILQDDGVLYDCEGVLSGSG
jgi:hypothetical protein